MAMSGAQSSAFLTAAGFAPVGSYTLFAGFAVALSLLWAAWAIYSCYRGWARGNLDREVALPSAIRVTVLCLILTFIVLS